MSKNPNDNGSGKANETKIPFTVNDEVYAAMRNLSYQLDEMVRWVRHGDAFYAGDDLPIDEDERWVGEFRPLPYPGNPLAVTVEHLKSATNCATRLDLYMRLATHDLVLKGIHQIAECVFINYPEFYDDEDTELALAAQVVFRLQLQRTVGCYSDNRNHPLLGTPEVLRFCCRVIQDCLQSQMHRLDWADLRRSDAFRKPLVEDTRPNMF